MARYAIYPQQTRRECAHQSRSCEKFPGLGISPQRIAGRHPALWTPLSRLNGLFILAQILGGSIYFEDEWGHEMKAQGTKLQATENDLKRLMADVARAMEKAQEAITRIASDPAVTAAETKIGQC